MSIKGKVVFVGDSGVGKTSVINNFSKNEVAPDPTIGSNTISCSYELDDTVVCFSVWDTAGQDDFRTLVPFYAKGAQVVILCYDVTSKDSFNNLPEWINFLKDKSGVDNIFLVENKIDLQREVSLQEAQEFAEDKGMKFFQTSAKTSEGINSLFQAIAREVNNGNDAPEQETTQTVKFTPAQPKKKKKFQC
ncbi:Ras family protein [Histomonas meleagridis]|uniref:Ras family protein n=1 Tax=Histomonas meleagridis TaxID=135588 RepID=UPI00355A003E|nr:Ras family protein [Histomonas meleagridis]KAH0797307.1 Ras family protein [Histomonas meleagridis]